MITGNDKGVACCAYNPIYGIAL